MQNAIKLTRPYTLTQEQKPLSTLANGTSAVGHTAGLFGGITVGVNVAKAMDDNGINTGLSIATGFIAGIVVMAGISIATKCASDAIRKKADIPSPLSMLCAGHDFDLQDYGSLLKDGQEIEDES